MNLTKAQFNELLNQHIGTGYLLLKMNDSTIRILDISLGRSGNWYAGLNGEKLLDKLSEITIELTDELLPGKDSLEREDYDKAREDYYKAREAYAKAKEAYIKAREACDKASEANNWEAYDKACEGYAKAKEDYDKASEDYDKVGGQVRL